MLRCIVWDVQHGSATTIITPDNKYIAVDLGASTSEGGFSPLLHLRDSFGVQQLHTVIVTHPHRDHLDDVENFDALSPRVLCRPSHLSDKEVISANRAEDNEKIDKYLEIHKRYNGSVDAGMDFQDPTAVGNVIIRTFIPTTATRTNINNHSVVVVASYAGSKILLPGDNEPVSWRELLGRKDFLDAISGTDILVAPHHGRDSGFCSDLFQHITPKLVLISDGRFCDTSATSRYSNQATGWPVHKRGGGREDRKCVTTRKDGTIDIRFWKDGTQPYLTVEID